MSHTTTFTTTTTTTGLMNTTESATPEYTISQADTAWVLVSFFFLKLSRFSTTQFKVNIYFCLDPQLPCFYNGSY
jgi:hypothetical protein